MFDFRVTCFKEDIGIFTAYGAKVKTNAPTPLGPHRPAYPPYCPPYPGVPKIPQNPGFRDKVTYDVVVYTNPDLTQSVIIYSHRNIEKCRLVLNNFIKMYLNGTKIIDLGKINDEFPIRLVECYNDRFDGPPPFPVNPWDKHWHDPRKDPYYDIFDNTWDDPHGRFAPPPPKPPFEPLPPFDYDRLPPPDGHEIHIRPEPVPHHHHPHPFDPWFDPHHCPPELRPENRGKIIFYFGNGGFAMGESVVNSIVEMSDNALRTMLDKNHRSTYTNMNPRDTINVKQIIRDTVTQQDTFEVSMDIAGEWCFFMIPDKFYRLVSNFNWYYKDETTDNKWTEAPLEMSEKTFTIQDNGMRYYINAIKLNGDYDVKFAKSGLIIPDIDDRTNPYDGRNLDPNMKYRVTLLAEGLYNSGKKVTIKDITNINTTAYTVIFNIMDNAWVDCLPNIMYEVDIVENDTSTAKKYFKVIENANYKKGYSVWISDTNQSEDLNDTTSDVVQFTVS